MSAHIFLFFHVHDPFQSSPGRATVAALWCARRRDTGTKWASSASASGAGGATSRACTRGCKPSRGGSRTLSACITTLDVALVLIARRRTAHANTFIVTQPPFLAPANARAASAGGARGSCPGRNVCDWFTNTYTCVCVCLSSMNSSIFMYVRI